MKIKQLIAGYTGAMRNFKPFYWLYNLRYQRLLQNNQAHYHAFGVDRPTWHAISAADILFPSDKYPWLDQADALEKLIAQPYYQQQTPELQNQLQTWIKDGFIILPGFLKLETIKDTNQTVDNLLTIKSVAFNYSGKKIMDAWRQAPLLHQIATSPKLLELLNFLLGRQVHLFQTINFILGSEQRPHADFIHMTTEPKGYLIACWLALDNVDADNGPLVYYPGSHRLPYLLSTDFDTGSSYWQIGKNAYKRYEAALHALIQKYHLKPAYFYARPGDLLIWHANLIHGGMPILNHNRTRKSMVMHYFAQNVLCYHDITQRPAIINPKAWL